MSIGTGDAGDDVEDNDEDDDNERGKLFVPDKSSASCFVSCVIGIMILFKTRSSLTEDEDDIEISDVVGELVPLVFVVAGVIEDDKDAAC